MLDNLLAITNRITQDDVNAGVHWYAEARQECQLIAGETGLPLEQVVGVVAATSPRTYWGKNIMVARTLIHRWLKNPSTTPEQLSPLPVTMVQRLKALQILRGRPIEATLIGANSNKTRSFYRCILNPAHQTEVCIDSHAYRQATGFSGKAKKISMTKPQYQEIQDAFRQLAKLVGLTPCQAQAVLWVHKTGQAGRTKQLSFFKQEGWQ
jgi:hypothetical protein